MRVSLSLSSWLPLLLVSGAYADQSSSLAPPGLLPLVNKANALLSAGQFSEAALSYSNAIELSPTDYVLYYKRATAYFSLSRHSSALEDFDKVLSLTQDTFDSAHLMKAKIYMKDGQWKSAQESLSKYSRMKSSELSADGASSSSASASVQDLENDLRDGENAAKKAANAKRAQLWTACSESATQALRIASHSVEVRQLRADCNLAAGDIESAVHDLTRLTHLTAPSTTSLMRTFRLSFFYLPLSSSSSPSSPISILKQCLHLDPDSKECLPAHRLVKSLEKLFSKLEALLAKEDWRGVVNLVAGSSSSSGASSWMGDGFAKTFEDALEANTARSQLLPSSSSSIPLPAASQYSPRRKHILRAACKAYTQMNIPRKGEPWCDAVLAMQSAGSADGGADAEMDALVGKGEALLAREEWEEAVRTFERAFEASGRSSRDIHQRLQRAQKLLKQSKQKDYYKVLGVARDADEKTIKKAYRKAVLKAHPDKGGSEAKMAAVNEAYEVLSKPELRARFDNGDDPNDPMSQNGGHPFAGDQHPFAQFFQHPASGGGFHGGQGGQGGHSGQQWSWSWSTGH